MCLRFVCYITYYYVTCRPTHLCLSCNSLYSSSRITTPARVSKNMATLISKLQHAFPVLERPGELQVLGGCGVWRDPSIPCLGLMMAWTRTGWSVSNRIWCGFLSKGWGGIWREVLLVTWWPKRIAARFDPDKETSGVSIISPFGIHWELLASVSKDAASKYQMLCNRKFSITACEGSFCVVFPFSLLMSAF